MKKKYFFSLLGFFIILAIYNVFAIFQISKNNFTLLSTSVSQIIQLSKSLEERQKGEKRETTDVNVIEFKEIKASIARLQNSLSSNILDTSFFSFLKSQTVSPMMQPEPVVGIQSPETFISIYSNGEPTELGSYNSFVIIPPEEDTLSVKVQKTGNVHVCRAYVIDTTGHFILKNEALEDIFRVSNPVEGFSITSDSTGEYEVVLSHASGTDTIKSCFLPKRIAYTITPEIETFPKKYDIRLKIALNSETVADCSAIIEIKLRINSQTKHLRESIRIPVGTTEYNKTITYPISGRIPYQFDVENIKLNPAASPVMIFSKK